MVSGAAGQAPQPGNLPAPPTALPAPGPAPTPHSAACTPGRPLPRVHTETDNVRSSKPLSPALARGGTKGGPPTRAAAARAGGAVYPAGGRNKGLIWTSAGAAGPAERTRALRAAGVRHGARGGAACPEATGAGVCAAAEAAGSLGALRWLRSAGPLNRRPRGLGASWRTNIKKRKNQVFPYAGTCTCGSPPQLTCVLLFY